MVKLLEDSPGFLQSSQVEEQLLGHVQCLLEGYTVSALDSLLHLLLHHQLLDSLKVSYVKRIDRSMVGDFVPF